MRMFLLGIAWVLFLVLYAKMDMFTLRFLGAYVGGCVVISYLIQKVEDAA